MNNNKIKKWLAGSGILLLCTCTAFAQSGKGRPVLQGMKALTTKAKTRALTLQITRQMVNSLPEPRLLSTQESKRILFPQTKNGNLFYVPSVLNTPQTAVYKGLSLPNLDALENMAKNGLELNKIQNAPEYAIFTSSQLSVALTYTIPTLPEERAIPVIVKIPVTKQCSPMSYNGYFVFVDDIPAQHIAEIMALLEIDGKATWYKIGWQKNKMLFLPATSEQFTADELKTHYFYAPAINLDMD